MAKMKTELRKFYRIMEITDGGKIRIGKYGYDNTFKWDRFDTEAEAIEYMDRLIEELYFGREYTIITVIERVWAD